MVEKAKYESLVSSLLCILFMLMHSIYHLVQHKFHLYHAAMMNFKIDLVCPLYIPRWGSFEEDDGVYKEIESLRGYELAIKAWSDWLEFHVNHTRTELFFMSMSPTHSS
jgi:GDSL/SGNH-like Acyl-Esterase family found in Pmr5 and Cas1p